MLEAGKLALPEEKTPAPDAKKVAVIGGGPAGLTAAGDLADAGFAVTVYEALSAAGGMLRWGIPEYRLPKKILDHEIELIRRKGVKFVYNCRIGEDITFQSLRQDYRGRFPFRRRAEKPQAPHRRRTNQWRASWRRIPPGRGFGEEAGGERPGPGDRRRQCGGGCRPDRPAPRRQEGRDGLPRTAR